MPEGTPKTVELLFFGDLVGKAGRTAVKKYLEQLEKKPDVTIANVENTTHGFGLIPKHYNEILAMGVDVMTSGNHIWDRKEILDIVPTANALLRPANDLNTMPGVGARVYEINGIKVGIINLIGQVFMGNYNSPLESFNTVLPALKEQTPILFLDFHAEASGEKLSFGHYAAKKGISAMAGTHTHVQTADEKILEDQMGYITDAGFNGAFNSVIGFQPQDAMARLKSQVPTRLEVSETSPYQINGIRYWIEQSTGRCLRLERVNTTVD